MDLTCFRILPSCCVAWWHTVKQICDAVLFLPLYPPGGLSHGQCTRHNLDVNRSQTCFLSPPCSDWPPAHNTSSHGPAINSLFQHLSTLTRNNFSFTHFILLEKNSTRSVHFHKLGHQDGINHATKIMSVTNLSQAHGLKDHKQAIPLCSAQDKAHRSGSSSSAPGTTTWFPNWFLPPPKEPLGSRSKWKAKLQYVYATGCIILKLKSQTHGLPWRQTLHKAALKMFPHPQNNWAKLLPPFAQHWLPPQCSTHSSHPPNTQVYAQL